MRHEEPVCGNFMGLKNDETRFRTLMDGADTSRRLLRRFIAQEPIDLVRAALAVAREEYPDLDEGRYLGLLDRLADGVQAGLPFRAFPEPRGGRMHACLLPLIGYFRQHAERYHARNSIPNAVLGL